MKKLLHYYFFFWSSGNYEPNDYFQYKGTVKTSMQKHCLALVLAIHTPTGSKYSSMSNEDGRFNMLNMRVGGPYKVTVTFVDFKLKFTMKSI
jgi:hypothetical protein